jgi:SEC-C motif
MMSNKVGRNDACPCGSGKKYKKCCQARFDETDFQYRRWRQVESRLIPELLSFALETLGPEVIEEAWSEFYDDEPDETFDPESPMNMLFMPWFLFNWIHEAKSPRAKHFAETTIAASFLNEYDLNVDEQKLLASAIHAPYSFHEVVEVRPGIGMTLFDLLRRVSCEALERTGSQTFRKGDILYCAMTHIDGITSNVGTGPYALRPTAKRDILELRKWIIEQTNGTEITVEDLFEFDVDIRTFYLDSVKAMFRPPQLTNTDKDPFIPHKLHFEIESAQAAFEALKDLAEGVSEDQLLANATRAAEEVVEVQIPWFGGADETRKRVGGPVLLGTIQIDNHKLVVEVNSTRRAETIKQLIAERLADKARYKTTLIEPIEVEKMWAETIADSSNARRAERESDPRYLVDLPPELLLKLKEDAERYWVEWMDVPVPALNNMTPREAAKTEEGRDLLESLLLLYESHDNEALENLFSPDVAALRDALGMQGQRD